MHAKETWNIAFVSYLASQVITRWNLKWEVINFPTAFDVNWRLSIATDCVTFFARNVIPYNRGTKTFPLIKNQHYPSPSTKFSASYLIRFSTISNAKRRWKQENRAILTQGEISRTKTTDRWEMLADDSTYGKDKNMGRVHWRAQDDRLRERITRGSDTLAFKDRRI